MQPGWAVPRENRISARFLVPKAFTVDLSFTFRYTKKLDLSFICEYGKKFRRQFSHFFRLTEPPLKTGHLSRN
jgi:hypothetical protein